MAPLEVGRPTPFKVKLDLALRLMTSKGINIRWYQYSVYGLLWFLGVPIRPPLFSGLVFNFLFHGVFFGTMFGAYMWLVLWHGQRPPTTVVMPLVAAGVLYGIYSAGYSRYKARKHKLPAWEELSSEAEIFD